MGQTIETWRAVPGYEGHYEVSDRGQVRSVDRIRPTTNHRIKGKIISPSRRKYLQVNLYRGGNVETVRVHRLVAAAFLGPCPDGMEVLHANDDGHDNRVTNLRYGTRSENSFDRIANGGCHNTNKTHCKRGHLLAGANIEGWHLRNKGARKCRACGLEWGRANRAGEPFDQYSADKFLEAVMSGTYDS